MESYYDILGVGSGSSADEIRRAYRKLAMRWHPDKWATNHGLLEEAKARFQMIQEAYSVLSDESKRMLYDAGLYEVDEGFADFVQEMVSLMAEVRREEKVYSLEELQVIFADMSKGFESSQSYYDTLGFRDPVSNSFPFIESDYNPAPSSKKARWDMDVITSGIGLTSGYFN